MNRKRLFSIDLDGTLLRPDYTIGPFTKHLLSELAKDGDIVFLSSGRPIRTLHHYYKEIGLIGPLGCYNGAYIGQPDNPLCFPVYDPCLNKKDIIEAVGPIFDKLDFFMGENHHLMVESRLNPFLEKYFPTVGTECRLSSSLEDLPENLKIFIFSATPEVAAEIERNIAKNPNYAFHSWKSEPYYEIILKTASKGLAAEKVAAYYGIAKEDIFAFGDSENDFSMLEMAGHPFAMKGCKSKRLAENFPTTEKGNAEEGVALEILKYCD